MLKENEQVPLDIELLDLQGEEVKLRDLLGKRVLLYFYPKDDTPGCTKEACSFRDSQKELSQLDIKVVGVSADSVKSHQKFKEKYQLNFDLWSDEDKQLSTAFGTWGEKKLFGKLGMGMRRSTFLINEHGTIEKVWPDVSVDQHLEEILQYLKNS